MIIPKVFVGTMVCGEGDYPDCKAAIEKQRYVAVTHGVVANLPERAAHNQLWEMWRTVKDNYDMFVKVDADTVLMHNEVIVEFWNLMRSNPRITGIQAPLADYFTDGFINGLNCFSPRVVFNDSSDELFCDRVDSGHDVVLRADDVPEILRPAGQHCHRATTQQAFHYGLHRALKGQVAVIDRVNAAWQRDHDSIRAYALLGAQRASEFKNGSFSYSDEQFKCAFDATVLQFDDLVKTLETSR